MSTLTIGMINAMPEEEKRAIYMRVVPRELLSRFSLPSSDSQRIQNFVKFQFASGTSDVEMSLYHEERFPDPILYGHLTDTLNGQIHILLYILNDPNSPRYDVDCMPDGRATKFGTLCRNLEAEEAAMNARLAPGQIRHGLRMLQDATLTFENFIKFLGHEIYFVEPLYYHNAIIFERYGFSYQEGRRFMERIQEGFGVGGDLHARLDNSTPFRSPAAQNSIRLRSWAIHDGILGEPFTNVTMYKHVGRSSGVNTCPNTDW
jgi:acetoin utilization protein AcuC